MARVEAASVPSFQAAFDNIAGKQNPDINHVEGVIRLPSGETIPLELVLQFMLYSLIKSESNHLKVLNQIAKKEYALKSTHDDLRIAKSNHLMEEMKSYNSIKRVEECASSASLAFSGLTALFTGNIPVGAFALSSAAFQAIDAFMLDNTMKKGIASWLAQGNQEAESAWQDRIKLFFTTASLCIGFGIQQLTAIKLGQQVGETSLAYFKGTLEQKVRDAKAELMQLDMVADTAERRLKRILEEMDRTSNQVYSYVDEKVQNNESRAQIFTQLCRSIY